MVATALGSRLDETRRVAPIVSLPIEYEYNTPNVKRRVALSSLSLHNLPTGGLMPPMMPAMMSSLMLGLSHHGTLRDGNGVSCRDLSPEEVYQVE